MVVIPEVERWQLSTPPALFASIVERLRAAGLVDESNRWQRGHDGKATQRVAASRI